MMPAAEITATGAAPARARRRPWRRSLAGGRQPKICFVAPHNYAILSGRSDIRHVGGAEVQRALLARELARRGYEVSFVTQDHGQPDGVAHDDIRVFKMCAASDGWPGLRFFHPRWTSLWAAMSRADADVYYQRTAGVETGQVALWCGWHRRPFIVGIANDTECDRRLGGRPLPWRERYLYRFGLLRADRVVAQTQTQRRMLRENLGIDTTVIRSCTLPPSNGGPEPRLAARPRPLRILWVGRFMPHKRLGWLLNLARGCPQYEYDVVGGARRLAPEVRAVIDELSRLPNVYLHGVQPYARMPEFYARAALLVLTSAWEGYPNTFLEAWARGVPTVGTVDPDNVVTANGLGRCAATPEQLRQAVEGLLSSDEVWDACARRARDFFAANHSIPSTADRFERLVRGLVST